jgi:hypothetical protein
LNKGANLRPVALTENLVTWSIPAGMLRATSAACSKR